ncbi:MAG: alginate export family protein [Deltaproteobacteria bacterium]|nr:alginate export family protein [Deltaproteobacteria bacterium]
MKKQWILILAAIVISAWVIPAYAAELKTSGHYRVRGFSVQNMTSGNALQSRGADEQWSFADHRFRLNLDVSEGPVMGRLQINSGNYNWGESQTSSAWNREMFLVFPLGGATVKIGKFWAEHPFNGVIFTGVAEQAYYIYPVTSDLTLIAAFVDADDTADKAMSVHVLVGIYKPKASIFSGAFGFYHGTLNDSSGSTYVLNASGLPGATTLTNQYYVEGRPMWLAGQIDAAQGPWKVGLTGASQFGDVDVTIPGGAVLTNNLTGYAFDARASYDFAKAGGPPLTLELVVGYGSGDDNANDNDINTFTGPLPSYTHTAIFLDQGDAGEGGAQLRHAGRADLLNTHNGIGNLKWIGLKAAYKATDKTTFKLTGASFYLAQEKVTGGTSYQDSELGQELDAALVHNLAKGLNLTLSGAWFMPNAKGWTTTTAATTASTDTISEYMAKLQFDF